MKRNLFWVGLIALVVCLSITFLTGCAKKAGVKSDTATTQEQKAVTKGPDRASSAADEAAARERALREKELKEQAEKEAAAKAAKEAAEKAKKEAAREGKGGFKRTSDSGY